MHTTVVTAGVFQFLRQNGRRIEKSPFDKLNVLLMQSSQVMQTWRYRLVHLGAGIDLAKRHPKLRFRDRTMRISQLVTGQRPVAEEVHSSLQSKLGVPNYRISKNPLRNVFREKIKLFLACLERWLMYVTHAEDEALLNLKWDAHFDLEKGLRPVMHDKTALRLPEPVTRTYNVHCGPVIIKGALPKEALHYSYADGTMH
jgi:hypothetical protein